MAGRMVQCSNTQTTVINDEPVVEQCARFTRLLVLRGGVEDPNFTYKCDSCRAGNKPYIPRTSARKGQQKQAKK
jgi:hypothetical protein